MHSFLETWCAPILSLCLCPIHPACVPTPCLKCVHASVHEFMSHLTPHDYSLPLCIVWWKPVCPYVSLFVCPSHPACVSPILFRMCTCISTCIYVHPDCPCMVQPCMHSLMEIWVPLFVTVHGFPVTLHLWSHTLFRTCTCIITWIYVHPWLPISGPPPMHSLMETCVCLCMAVCLFPSHLICVPTPCLECVHASVYKFMSTWLSMSGPHPLHSLMETWVPL